MPVRSRLSRETLRVRHRRLLRQSLSQFCHLQSFGRRPFQVLILDLSRVKFTFLNLRPVFVHSVATAQPATRETVARLTSTIAWITNVLIMAPASIKSNPTVAIARVDTQVLIRIISDYSIGWLRPAIQLQFTIRDVLRKEDPVLHQRIQSLQKWCHLLGPRWSLHLPMRPWFQRWKLYT